MVEMKEMYIELQLENFNKTDHLGDLGMNGRMI
jgi:hypothetical protein